MRSIAFIPARAGSVRKRRSDFGTTKLAFWGNIDPSATEAGCWPWTGCVNLGGYGVYGSGRAHTVLAHRRAYELLVGPVPTNTLDHLCRNRRCINPAHLEAVSRGENIRRGVGVGRAQGDRNLAKTHCPQDHPYDEANTYVIKTRRGSLNRQCRACSRLKARRRRLGL